MNIILFPIVLIYRIIAAGFQKLNNFVILSDNTVNSNTFSLKSFFTDPALRSLQVPSLVIRTSARIKQLSVHYLVVINLVFNSLGGLIYYSLIHNLLLTGVHQQGSKSKFTKYFSQKHSFLPRIPKWMTVNTLGKARCRLFSEFRLIKGVSQYINWNIQVPFLEQSSIKYWWCEVITPPNLHNNKRVLCPKSRFNDLSCSCSICKDHITEPKIRIKYCTVCSTYFFFNSH